MSPETYILSWETIKNQIVIGGVEWRQRLTSQPPTMYWRKHPHHRGGEYSNINFILIRIFSFIMVPSFFVQFFFLPRRNQAINQCLSLEWGSTIDWHPEPRWLLHRISNNIAFFFIFFFQVVRWCFIKEFKGLCNKEIFVLVPWILSKSMRKSSKCSKTQLLEYEEILDIFVL